jgi:nitrogen regulatory protein P-II 1
LKRIEIYISPLHLEPLRDRLRMIAIPGMTVYDVLAVTPQPHETVYRGATVRSDLVQRMRVDIVVPDDWVEGIVTATVHAIGKTDQPGGRILITPVDEVIRIRTGEMGVDAI